MLSRFGDGSAAVAFLLVLGTGGAASAQDIAATPDPSTATARDSPGRDPPRPRPRFATITIAGDRPFDVTLTPGADWMVGPEFWPELCRTPCQRRLPRGTYRVSAAPQGGPVIEGRVEVSRAVGLYRVSGATSRVGPMSLAVAGGVTLGVSLVTLMVTGLVAAFCGFGASIGGDPSACVSWQWGAGLSWGATFVGSGMLAAGIAWLHDADGLVRGPLAF